MLSECLAIVGSICLTRPADVRIESSTTWSGATIKTAGLRITSTQSSDSVMTAHIPSTRRACRAGQCLYYKAYCSTAVTEQRCRIWYTFEAAMPLRVIELAGSSSALRRALPELRLVRSPDVLVPLSDLQVGSEDWPPVGPADDAGACQPLLTPLLSDLAAKVATEPDREERIKRLVELADYWKALCASDRAKASPRAVRAVARLLRLGPPRWLIAEMLFDVGPNLRSAEPELTLAMRDEQRRDAAALRQTSPIMPTNYGVLVDEFRCLRHKARTGRTDIAGCRWALAVKAAERG